MRPSFSVAYNELSGKVTISRENKTQSLPDHEVWEAVEFYKYYRTMVDDPFYDRPTMWGDVIRYLSQYRCRLEIFGKRVNLWG